MVAFERVGFGIAEITQVFAHGRMVGHILQQCFEIAEGIPDQHIIIGDPCIREGQQRTVERYHQYLAQCESDTLTQLVLSVHCDIPPAVPLHIEQSIAVFFPILRTFFQIGCTIYTFGMILYPGYMIVRLLFKLFFYPLLVIIEPEQAVDLFCRCTECRT